MSSVPSTVILRFILECGDSLQVVTTLEEAKSIVKDWTSGSYKIRGVSHICDLGTPLPWSVRLESVQCIHVIIPQRAFSAPYTDPKQLPLLYTQQQGPRA